MKSSIVNNLQLPEPPPGFSGWPWTEASSSIPENQPDGSPWPKISVVTPSYNQGHFLEEGIRSVLLQGYPNLEYIIIDGGSTDNSVEVIRKYEPWLAYWVCEPDRGQSHAVNKGIIKATGEILFWLNADDVCLPDAFIKVAYAYKSYLQPKIIVGQARIIDGKGNVTGVLRSGFSTWNNFISRTEIIRQVSTFFDRTLFDELGLIDESLKYSMDYDILLRFTRHHTPTVLEDFLSAFRLHSNNQFDSNKVKGYEECDRVTSNYAQGRSYSGYRRWSANNWLSLTSNKNLSHGERITSLFRAIRMQPFVMVWREFWASLGSFL